MSNSIKKAKIELSKIGYKSINKCKKDEPDKLIQEGILKLLKIFSEQGHSNDAPFCINFFKTFSRFKSIEEVKNEFIKIGFKPIEECEDDPDKWMQENVIELMEEFLTFNTTVSKTIIDHFVKLALHEPLSEIMCTDDEWTDVTAEMGDITYQNNRCAAIFKNGENGKPYYLDAIRFINQDGIDYTSNCVINTKGNIITSSQTIKHLPFEPKTFYIDVIEKEISPNNFGSYIKDESQLEEVWKVYENPIKQMRKEKIDKLNEI